MASDSATSQANGITNRATGSFTGDGTATAVTCGFVPRVIHLVNATDRITQDWYEGLAATQTINTAADGVRTLNTSSLLVPKGSADSDGYKGFLIAADAAVSAKAYVWVAEG